MELGIPSMFAQKIVPELKLIYARYLYPFEQVVLFRREPGRITFPIPQSNVSQFNNILNVDDWFM